LATSAHVLGRAKSADIRLPDGRLIAVHIVGQDARTDIALLKAPAEFPVLDTAPPTALGARVCAVGNQFGLGLNVTCGVVSAVNRSNAGFNLVEDFIQTDASVNPGGSGGALVDADSRLIGLVSSIFTKKSDANIGVNFAASVALVMRVVHDLMDHGKVRHGNPGFELAPLTRAERRTAAGAAGLQAGDIIAAVGARPVVLPSDVTAALYLLRPGDGVDIVFRRGKLEHRVRLVPRE